MSVRFERLALLPLLLLALVFVQYAVSNPRLLHIDVAFTPAAFLGAAVAAALCLLIIRSRDFALVLLVAAVYLNLSNVLVRQGFPSLLQLAAIPLLLAALTNRQPADWLRLARQPLTWMLVGYTLVLLGSTVYAQAPQLADERFGDTAKALLIYALIVLLASSERRVHLAMWTMLLAGSLLAALGILRILDINVPGLSDGLARLELAHIHGNVFEPRITGPLGDANFFAQILLVLAPIGLFLAWETRSRWQRLAAYGSVALIVGATVLTYSRGGAVALAFVLVMALLASGISWKRLASGAAVLALLWTMAIPADFAARLSTVRQFLPGGEEVLHRDSSFEERMLLTGTAWQMFIDNPARGVGGGNYSARFNEYSQRLSSTSPDYHDESAPRYPHNLFLEVGAETGLLGLAVFVAALLAAFTALNRVRRSPSLRGLNGLARAVQIGIAGYLVSSLFLHGDFQRYLWLLIGLAGAMEALVVQRPRARRDNQRTKGESLAATNGSGPDPVEQGTRPATRRGIAVLLSRFPSVTETFILREVIEMERQGQPVCLMPLLREHPPIVHAEARPWVERAVYTPFLSLPIVAANLRALLRHPARYITLVSRLLLGTLRSPRVFAGTISIIPKSFYLAERARALGIKHVHAHFATHPTTAALIISAFADTSFSFTIHAHDLFSRKYRPLLRMKLDEAAFVRVISSYNRGHLRALYPGAPLEKVHVVHVGIEPELYGSAALVDRDDKVDDATPEVSPATVKLMSVAALRDYKGIPVLLSACRRLLDDGMNVRCDVVGEGPMRPKLEREIHRLGLEQCVRLVGAKPQDEVRRLLAERPIFVLSSIVMPDGWMEGIPVALMEAMASGAAVVTSRISGIPELVEDGVSGVLVEQGDPDALARAIRKLAAAPDVALKLGIAGGVKVNAAFRLDMTVTQLLALIDLHNESVAPVVTEATTRGLNGTLAGTRVGVRAVHEGTDATVAELVVGEEGGSVHQWVLKIHRDHAGASSAATHRAENEGEALAALSDGVGVATARGSEPRRNLGVPRLIRRSSEGWLVMESCAGTSLAQLLRVSRGSLDGEQWQSTLTVIRQTGDWLRGLQQRELNVDEGSAIAEWHAALATDLDRCRSVVGMPVLLEVQEQLAASLTSADAPSFAVLHHGDFGPGNVFVSKDRIQVIDFEGWRPGLPYEDVAYFAMQLELFFQYPLLRGRGQQAVAAFLEGYLNGEPLDSHAYLMARKSKALQILARASFMRPADLAGRRRRSALQRALTDRPL